ncbi:lysozyme inhibitor LprI family protein [Comamonas sp. NoAH]|uniref:lysozyme inhibitor LprI family protein n=1 Tax=Comamonas halotolerans TaxID=3041496 RepID=UPI0024E17FA1|nr:lysozyme inhibitor LprI family protein [Comamonas sp. NoAH]
MKYRISPWICCATLAASLLIAAKAQAQAGAVCDPQSSNISSSNACAVQRFQQADTAQNILYGDVMRALSAHERPALRKDQAAWSRQRMQRCKAQHASDEGRADWPQRLHDCLTQATELRRQALMHWLHQERAPDS